MSVRRTVTRSRERALSQVEGDPMPLDIQQRPDRESYENLGPRLFSVVADRAAKRFVIPTRERSETGGTCFLPGT